MITNLDSGSKVLAIHLFYGLPFLQPNDVSDAFAFDIMSCSPTSDKCDQFSDYSCVFSEPGRSFNSSSPQDSSSCELSATAMLQYTICRRVFENFNQEGIAFTLTVCTATCL